MNIKQKIKRDDVIRALREEMPVLRDRFGVTRLALFGSVAKGNAGPGSDIDLLVETERPLGFSFVTLANYLEKTLGQRVDLVTVESLARSRKASRHRHIVRDIEKTLINVNPTA